MLQERIIELIQYNRWANSRLLSAVDLATLDTQVVSSFTSIRATVYHSWDAETIWFERIQNKAVTPWPASASFKGDFTEARQAILDQEQEMINFLQQRDDQFLTGEITYKNLKGNEISNSIFHVFQHMVNHSATHRGQIITMMRQLGVTQIPPTDLIAFYREHQIKIQ